MSTYALWGHTCARSREPAGFRRDERRFITTGNTDDADLTDFRGYEIRVYPHHPRNPCSFGGRQTFITIYILKSRRRPKSRHEFYPMKNPNPGHEDVQGMLLELGKIYGYETSAAINDARKKFMNMPIEEVATIKEFQKRFIFQRLWK